MKMTDIKVGQTINFIYWAGSTPGNTRVVVVDQIFSSGVGGFDQDLPEGDNYRRFRFDDMEDIKVVKAEPVSKPTLTTDRVVKQTMSFQTVRYSCTQRITALNGDELAALYQYMFCKPGLNEVAHFDAASCSVIVTVPQPVRKMLTLSAEDGTITVLECDGTNYYDGDGKIIKGIS